MAKPKRVSSVTPQQIIETRGDLTQTQAAQLMGISRRQWQNMEAGDVAMSETAFVEFKRLRSGVNDFARGYFCAVAILLREKGAADTYVRSLFNQGGIPSLASPEDIELFRAHGLME